MKKLMIRFCQVIAFLLLTTPVCAQSKWQCDIYAYEYDMAVYFQMMSGSNPVEDYSNSEIGAFCGDECRGISEVLTIKNSANQDVKVGYIRVRSNQTQGETISFKVYDKTTEEVTDLRGKIVTFTSNAIVGLPSQPIVFRKANEVTPGDADGDGVVDLTDATLIFDYYMDPSIVIDTAAADFDGDGTVDLTDAVGVFEYYMNQ